MARRVPDSFLPMWDGDMLRERVRQYDRTPFLDLLTAWLECGPTPEAVIAFAEKNPDKYINALTSLGKLAGFTEKREVEWHGSLNVGAMSDSQLEDKLAEIASRLGLPAPKTIEHT